VEPAGAGQQLVGILAGAEKIDQTLELARVFGADVGSLAEQVLRVTDATHKSIHARVAEAGVDEDGTNHLACGLQQILATVLQVKQHLRRWQVVGVLPQVEKFRQMKVRSELNVIELCVFH
jgi:ubiquinone biosynthesis protein UbiJ